MRSVSAMFSCSIISEHNLFLTSSLPRLKFNQQESYIYPPLPPHHHPHLPNIVRDLLQLLNFLVFVHQVLFHLIRI
jgi:hypothetical protein